MKPIFGIFDDDGNPINADLVPKPGLCLVCKNNEIDDPIENVLCVLTRLEQKDDEDFECCAFDPISPRKNY